ncbi:MAG TPA: PEP/pyruvate-binding domain-containing protein [Anaeromyxobacter sp.]|nr:PEP/pyruvate-binding domain-containing protein [Anaeromyxobacter sp.]
MAGSGRLVSDLLTGDARLAELAARCLDLRALLAIRRRRIGAGLVGGKAAGMLLARAILLRADPRWASRLEPHDAWFVGADAFREHLVRSGAPVDASRDGGSALLANAAAFRERIRAGPFPEELLARLRSVLARCGDAPIVVRSSSILEDGFDNAFTGKYESVFCANRGPPEARLAALLAAIREVWASAFADEALRYRQRRGILDREEAMAVVVQRVSGAAHGELFFPHVAGVALSYNPWAWDEAIDPRAGMARIVFGLGTRAVDRPDDDHTRLVALDQPLARPDGGRGDPAEHAQRRVDVVDLSRGGFASLPFEEVARASPGLPLDLFAAAGRGGPPVLTFHKLLAATPFAEWVRALVRTLADVYRFPVEVELTANFLAGGRLQLNVVQCRPLQIKEGGTAAPPPKDLPEDAVVLASRGPIVGRSTSADVDRVVFVDPDAYDRLALPDRHEVARVVGRAVALGAPERLRVLLVGPGRWGTRTLTAGVPTSFAEIHGAAAICEVVRAGGQGAPEVSLGSHFFDELVEADMLYLAVHAGRPGHRIADGVLRAAPNRLREILPRDARLADVVRVIDFPLRGDRRSLRLHADFVRQEALCYLSADTRP